MARRIDLYTVNIVISDYAFLPSKIFFGGLFGIKIIAMADLKSYTIEMRLFETLK